MFRMSQYLRIDHRISIAHFLNQASIQEVLLWVHPRLYGFELTDIKERSRNWLPQVQPLFCASLSQSKIYLLETNMVAYIWTGANVPIQYIARLVEIDSWTYDEYDTSDSVDVVIRKVHSALGTIRKRRQRHLRLLVIRTGDSNERVFMEHMRYDSVFDSPSHSEFLSLVIQRLGKRA
eukprot:TRINITY_DN4389_c0_g1_i1.p1 TRINITY_DN4389_c0_g1~~TRINITY_DN4389_c0_g1_i1.p1  ORF type:complete len:178 (+),score=14.68 TRINITY_DN4389_c0_g1_i1:405-938(+)